jgi:DNA polymerase-3 subunit delta
LADEGHIFAQRVRVWRIKMIKIFHGSDEFGIAKEIEKISDGVTKVGGEIEIIYTDNALEFVPKLLSVSFFTQERLFIVRGLLYALPSEDIKEIVRSGSEIAEGTTVIFLEKSIGKKSELLDFIKKHGEIKSFETRTGTDPKTYIRNRFKEEGVDIAPLAVERLSSFVGNDMWQLTEEVNKLILYKKDEEIDPCVDSADVDLLVKSNFEANIFELLDSIANKNSKKSSELINNFLESGENAIYILTMIEKQFRNIAMAKFEDGISEFSLAKKAGVHPFVAKKSVTQARSYSKEEILGIYKKLSWADLKLKSGSDPAQILLRIVA